MGNSAKPVRLPAKIRDLTYAKPEQFQDYLTLAELSREVQRDPRYLRKLEAANRIPKAKRVKLGSLSVRLWSPNQVQETREILSTMKRGRPSNG